MNKHKRLQSLAGDAEKQAAYAVTLIEPGRRHDILLTAMQVLGENPSEEAHEPLTAVYQHLAIDGVKRDSGAYVRTAALNALRPIARISDTPLLLQAIATYEYLPPAFRDEAGVLRAAALLVLNELDDETTSYYAARFLVDGQSAQMSGEPALTAVRVLASRAEFIPLYQYVVQGGGRIVPEVASDCLRHLTTLPESLLQGVIALVNSRSSPVEAVGLFDLLIEHESGPQALPYIASYLRDPDDLDVYRYVLLTAMAARQDALTQLICEIAQDETAGSRQAVLLEALNPYSANDLVRETLEQISTN